MATNYPTSLDTGSTTLRTDITATTELDDVGFYHDEQHVNAHGAVIAVETKLGVGSSDASAAGAGTVLVHSGSGSTGWSAAATGVTSVGTLSSLTVSGDVTVDTDTLHVDSTNNRVGIGTTSPSKSLHIYHATIDHPLVIESGDVRAGLEMKDSTTVTSPLIRASGDDLQLRTGGSDNLVIKSDGNVGIGTTSPSELLDINAGTSGSVELTTTGGRTIQLTANDSEPFLSVGSTSAHSAAIMTNGVRRLTVNSSGNVGINDNSPSYTLDVNGTGRFTGDVITDDLTVNCSSTELKVQGSVGGVQFITRNTGNRWVIYNSSSALRFYVDGSSDRLQITSSETNVTSQLRINGGPLLSDPSSANYLRVTSAYGYIDLGPQNTSWSHIYTDRAAFYLNKRISMPTNSEVRGYISLATDGGDYAAKVGDDAYIGDCDVAHMISIHSTTSTTQGKIQFCRDSGPQIGAQDTTYFRMYSQVVASGLATTTGNNTIRYNSSSVLLKFTSLREKKTDITPITGVLDYLNEKSPLYNLEPVMFHEKDQLIDGETYNSGRGEWVFGFIAEDVHDVAPELTSMDEDGALSSVSIESMVPLLVAEVQRLGGMVDELYGDANPDWVPPTPRPDDRGDAEKALFDAAALEIAAATEAERIRIAEAEAVADANREAARAEREAERETV